MVFHLNKIVIDFVSIVKVLLIFFYEDDRAGSKDSIIPVVFTKGNYRKRQMNTARHTDGFKEVFIIASKTVNCSPNDYTAGRGLKKKCKNKKKIPKTVEFGIFCC